MWVTMTMSFPIETVIVAGNKKQRQCAPRLLTMAGFELRLLCDELLNAHAVVDVADVNRTIFANSNVVTPIDLAIVVAKAAPFGEDFPGKVEFQELAAIGR